MLYRVSFILFFTLLLQSSCGNSSEEGVKLQSAVVSFIENTDDIVGYGFLDLAEVVQKGNLNEIEELGSFFNQQLSDLEEGISISERLFFVLKGPLYDNETPSNIYFFMQIKNLEKFQSLIDEMGFSIEQEGRLKWHSNDDFSLGYDENFLIVVTSENNQDEEKIHLVKAFEEIYKESKNKEIGAYLSQQKDFSFVASLASLSSIPGYQDETLMDNRDERIKSATKDAKISFSLTFNEGNIVSEFELLNANDTLKEMFFFQEHGPDDILSELEGITPDFAITAAIDVEKLDNLITFFNPDTKQEFIRSFGKYGLMFESVAGDDIGNVTNGKIGVVFSEENDTFNIHSVVGWGKEKQNILDIISSLAEEGTLTDLGNGYYHYEGSLIKTSEDFLVFHENIPSNVEDMNYNNKTSHKVDNKGYPFYIFFDVKNNQNMVGSIYKSNDYIVRIIDYIEVFGNNEKFKVEFVLHQNDKNALSYFIESIIQRYENSY